MWLWRNSNDGAVTTVRSLVTQQSYCFIDIVHLSHIHGLIGGSIYCISDQMSKRVADTKLADDRPVKRPCYDPDPSVSAMSQPAADVSAHEFYTAVESLTAVLNRQYDAFGHWCKRLDEDPTPQESVDTLRVTLDQSRSDAVYTRQLSNAGLEPAMRRDVIEPGSTLIVRNTHYGIIGSKAEIFQRFDLVLVEDSQRSYASPVIRSGLRIVVSLTDPEFFSHGTDGLDDHILYRLRVSAVVLTAGPLDTTINDARQFEEEREAKHQECWIPIRPEVVLLQSNHSGGPLTYNLAGFELFRSILKIPYALVLNGEIRNVILSEVPFHDKEDIPGDVLELYRRWSITVTGILALPPVLHQLVSGYIGPLAVADAEATEREQVKFRRELDQVTRNAPLLRILDVPLRQDYLILLDGVDENNIDDVLDLRSHVISDAWIKRGVPLDQTWDSLGCDDEHIRDAILCLFCNPFYIGSFGKPAECYDLGVVTRWLPRFQLQLREWLSLSEIDRYLSIHRSKRLAAPWYRAEAAELSSALALLSLVPPCSSSVPLLESPETS